jgi:hypothetical protein
MKSLHPTPPRVGGRGEQRLLVESPMAVPTRPRQRHVETVAGLQLMHGV